MIVCAPVTLDGNIDPRWGRADWIAIADLSDGKIKTWREIEVLWSRLVKFLKEHGVEAVVANHMGDGMTRMLKTMEIPVHLGAQGDARAAVQELIS
jgi:predicted Fe-Mo cluster-binding NifX family protein